MGREQVNGRLRPDSASISVIAEINTGHFGNLEAAAHACAVAKNSGASHIKFQSWSPESLFTRTHLEANSLERRMYQKFALSQEALLSLRMDCRRIGIGFGSTAYSPQEAEYLAEIDSDFIKIASMDIVSPHIIRAAAATQTPTIISTGMASLEEIKNAVYQFMDEGGKDLTVLHCTSLYPTPLNESSLGFIAVLQEELHDIPIGYSDHTQGVLAAATALGLGARVFEKHFTLDTSRPGFDNAMAESEEGLGAYISQLSALGKSVDMKDKVISEEEFSQSLKMRRSAHFAEEVSQGERLRLDSLEFKRPGTGIGYERVLSLLGLPLRRNVFVGELLEEDSVVQT